MLNKVDISRKPEFSQCFGDKAALEELTDADLLTTIEFDDNGDYLATGDRGGRVVIFERGQDIKSASDGRPRWACKYKFYSEFQSHEPEFDYLKSLEIEEKINQVKWCRKTNGAHFLLTANDKTIKLWKVHEKKTRAAASEVSARHNLAPLRSRSCASDGDSQMDECTQSYNLTFPRLYTTGTVTCAQNKRSFPNAHAYHINSLSVNPDGETFLSADDLRMNLWNLNVNHTCFNIVDIKPHSMDDLNEVITSASYHPIASNIMMYSSSRGTIRLADLRAAALCRNHAKVFDNHIEDPMDKSFFSEIISSIADAKFSRCGRYIFSRDYLTLKIWDTHKESEPISIMNVNQALRPHLADLYETDAIFDKFECCVSGDGQHVATGTYNNLFQVHDREGQGMSSTEVSRSVNRKKAPLMKSLKSGRSSFGRASSVGVEAAGETMSFDKKIMHLAWHPQRDVLAVAGLNRLYFYTV